MPTRDSHPGCPCYRLNCSLLPPFVSFVLQRCRIVFSWQVSSGPEGPRRIAGGDAKRSPRASPQDRPAPKGCRREGPCTNDCGQKHAVQAPRLNGSIRNPKSAMGCGQSPRRALCITNRYDHRSSADVGRCGVAANTAATTPGRYEAVRPSFSPWAQSPRRARPAGSRGSRLLAIGYFGCGLRPRRVLRMFRPTLESSRHHLRQAQPSNPLQDRAALLDDPDPEPIGACFVANSGDTRGAERCHEPQ